MYQAIRTPQMFPELGQLVCGGYDVFNDWWSTFIPEHKKALEEKIVRYYWFNQIGAETPDRFKHFLNAELMRIMPYYNQLYESELIKFNPTYGVDWNRKGNKTGNESGSGSRSTSGNNSGTNTQSGTSSNTRKDLYSDTPQLS